MSKGARITKAKKLLIAADYVAGLPLPEIAEKHAVTEGAIGRLRREDTAYREIEKELSEEMIAEAQRRPRSLIGKAVGVLEEIATLDHVQTPSGAGKILTERRRAAGDLLKWADTLRALGEEPEDPQEALLEKLIQERMMQSLQQEGRQPETQDRPDFGPPTPPLCLFRQPAG